MTHIRRSCFMVNGMAMGMAVAAHLGVAIADAQTSHPEATTPDVTETSHQATPTSAADASSSDPLAIFRAPLLREGSVLVDAHAALAGDASTSGWRLMLQDSDPGHSAQDLVLLPCTTLSEMRRFVEASPNQRIVFQVTGEVYLYRGRNYVLPTHAPVLSQEQTHAPAPAATSAATQPVQNAPVPSSESAEDIVRRLERATGPLARNATPPAASQTAATTDTLSRPAANGASLGESILRENTAIVARRGKLKRDISGGWMFVFDADASGLADPPLKLLPCLLLERIEDYARKTGNNSPALLSGQIHLFEGHGYLLPTVFRIPQDRRNLTP